jgi:hypothetical protein
MISKKKENFVPVGSLKGTNIKTSIENVGSSIIFLSWATISVKFLINRAPSLLLPFIIGFGQITAIGHLSLKAQNWNS